MKNAYDIIKRPVLTEKAYEGIDDKRYVFEVDIHANKAEIKAAIETVFADDGVKVEKTKPSFAIDDDDESQLNEEQRKANEAIRDALADNDKPRVLKLVQKMQSSDEWPDGIPKSIKMAAIEALGWFGVSCLPEIPRTRPQPHLHPGFFQSVSCHLCSRGIYECAAI